MVVAAILTNLKQLWPDVGQEMVNDFFTFSKVSLKCSTGFRMIENVCIT